MNEQPLMEAIALIIIASGADEYIVYKHANVAQTTLDQWKHGIAHPTLWTVVRIALACYVLGKKEKPRPAQLRSAKLKSRDFLNTLEKRRQRNTRKYCKTAVRGRPVKAA